MADRARGRLVASTSAGASVRLDPSASPRAGAIRTAVLTASGLRRLEAKKWLSGKYAGRAGAAVNVSVSPAYASDPGMAQRWADFFSSLLLNSREKKLPDPVDADAGCCDSLPACAYVPSREEAV